MPQHNRISHFATKGDILDAVAGIRDCVPSNDDIMEVVRAIRDETKRLFSEQYKSLDVNLTLRMNKSIENELNKRLEEELKKHLESVDRQYQAKHSSLQEVHEKQIRSMEERHESYVKNMQERHTQEVNEIRQELGFIRQSCADSIRQVTSLVERLQLPTPTVTVTTPEVIVNVPQPAVNVSVPEQRIPDVVVNVPEIRLPENATPVVNVSVPEIRMPEVVVNVPQPRLVKKYVEYDQYGRPSEIREEEG